MFGKIRIIRRSQQRFKGDKHDLLTYQKCKSIKLHYLVGMIEELKQLVLSKLFMAKVKN